jgi:excisionase family DNA binding protein
MDLLGQTTSTTDLDGQNAPSNRLLTVEAVADLCGVSKRMVYRWLKNDGLPAHCIPGTGARRILRIAQHDLDQWLGQFRHDAAAKRPEQTIRLEGRRLLNPHRQKAPDSGLTPFRRRVPVPPDSKDGEL